MTAMFKAIINTDRPLYTEKTIAIKAQTAIIR